MHRSLPLLFALALSVGPWASRAGAQDGYEDPLGSQPDPEDERPAPDAAQPRAAPTPDASAGASPADGSPTPPPPPPNDGDFAGSGADIHDDPLSYESSEDDSIYAGGAEELREFSIRFDPLNWLLLGRLGIELEMGLWEFISVELIPMFVTAGKPIALNYARLDDTLTQHSRGIGPISGASLGVGFWLFGEPFSGYVIRLNFTNYAYTYEAADGGGVFDRVKFTERRVATFFGSHSRFGPFTFAGGLGLGIELNQVERCRLASRETSGGERVIDGSNSDCEGRQQIALDRNRSETADLNGPLHPVYFEARFSLGVVF